MASLATISTRRATPCTFDLRPLKGAVRREVSNVGVSSAEKGAVAEQRAYPDPLDFFRVGSGLASAVCL